MALSGVAPEYVEFVAIDGGICCVEWCIMSPEMMLIA
jgi:hypothetical protein